MISRRSKLPVEDYRWGLILAHQLVNLIEKVMGHKISGHTDHLFYGWGVMHHNFML